MWVTSGLYVGHIRIVQWISGSNRSTGATHFQPWTLCVCVCTRARVHAHMCAYSYSAQNNHWKLVGHLFKIGTLL